MDKIALDKKESAMRPFLAQLSAALTAAVIMAVGPLPARAGLVLEYTLDGGPRVLLSMSASYSTAFYDAALGEDFHIHGLTESGGGIGGLHSTVNISNTTDTTHTLGLFIGDVNLVNDKFPEQVVLISFIRGQVAGPSSANDPNSFSFNSCIDPQNGQNTCGTTTPGLIVAGPLTACISFPSACNIDGSFAAATSVDQLRLNHPYSIGEDLSLTLGGGANIQLLTHTDLFNSAVPEPSAVGLVLPVLVLLGTLIHRRRRSQDSGAT